MEHNEAINYLKNYECVCPYGTKPNSCKDENCDFRKAIFALEYKTDNLAKQD